MKKIFYLAFIISIVVLFSCSKPKKAVEGVEFQNEIAELTDFDGVKSVYRFSDSQKAYISAVNKQFHTLSIALTVKRVENTAIDENIRFSLISADNEIASATANTALLSEKSLMLSICAVTMPDGFAIECKTPIQVLKVDALESQIGYLDSGDLLFYGFGARGGEAKLSRSSVDFSSARGYFNTSAGTYATIVYVPAVKKGSLNIAIGGERFVVRRANNQKSSIIQSTAVADIFQGIAFDDQSVVAGCLLRFNPKIDSQGFVAVKTDPGLIPDWNEARWRNRDYEVFSWEEFPNVLIFDIRNYDVQDAFLKRLAFFAEKRGFKGTLQTDAAMKGMHGYNAHDYRTETLADFYNKATDENFPLGEKELLLKSILISNGLLSQDGAHVSANDGALISISRESPEYLRWQFLNHEGFHGVFFTHEELRAKMAEIYNKMDYKSLEFVKSYYRVSPELDYDTTDLYLVQNELMAYTIQHKVSSVAPYYKNLASRAHVQKAIPDLANYILDTNAAGFTAIAKEIDYFVNENYGLNAGRVYLITRQ